MQLLDERQAAELLGVSRGFMEKHRALGDGPPFVRISSRCIRYKLRDLEAWIESRRRGAIPDQIEPIRRIQEVQ